MMAPIQSSIFMSDGMSNVSSCERTLSSLADTREGVLVKEGSVCIMNERRSEHPNRTPRHAVPPFYHCSPAVRMDATTG